MRLLLVVFLQVFATASAAADCDGSNRGQYFQTALTQGVAFLGMAYACEPRIGPLPRTIGRMMIEETLRTDGMDADDAIILGEEFERKAQAEAAELTTAEILARRWDEADVCFQYVSDGQRQHRLHLANLRKSLCRK